MYRRTYQNRLHPILVKVLGYLATDFKTVGWGFRKALISQAKAGSGPVWLNSVDFFIRFTKAGRGYVIAINQARAVIGPVVFNAKMKEVLNHMAGHWEAATFDALTLNVTPRGCTRMGCPAGL
jgi:hypothetical protein